MLPKPSAKAVAVKKEDKEAMLKSFVAAHLKARETVPPAEVSFRTFLVVARSSDSPVVAALLSLRDELFHHGIGVDAVLTGEAADRTLVKLAASGWNVRRLNDMRYRDAHEQLVLGPATAWVGDCMRREPLKRDAFESYAEACAATASFARISFHRLWQKAIPARMPMPCETAHPEDPAEEVCPAVASLSEQAADHGEAPVGLTRQ